MKRYITIIILALTCLTACDDFLDVIPTGKVIPTTVEDYDKLLNNASLVYNTWGNMAYMDPDLYMPENNYNNMWLSRWRKQYTWSENPFDDKDRDPDHGPFHWTRWIEPLERKVSNAPRPRSLRVSGRRSNNPPRPFRRSQ